MSSFSLRKQAIQGTVWTVISFGLSQILRFGSNLLLTRLLFPKLFGLIALINIVIIGLQLFSDIGLGPCIIQNKRGDDPNFLNTVWTLQVVRSLGLWFFCVLVAWPCAKFYGEAQFLWLIPIVGLNTIVSGFNSTALFTLNRQMAVSQLAVFELGTQIISLAVMLTWAWFNPTIWALVAGGLTSSVVQMVWSHQLIPGVSNRIVWERESVKEIFSFGKWIFFSTVVTFLGGQADRLMMGSLISIEILGIYGIAFALSDIPRQVIAAVSNKVIFPIFSQFTDLPREALRAKIIKNRMPILIAIAPGLALLVSFGDMLISVLYDERYAQAVWMLPLLALGIWPRILTQTIDPVLLAIGKPYYSAFANFLKFLFMVVGLPLGFSLMGLAGVITVIALNDLPFYGVITYGLWREKLFVIKQDIKATALFLLLLSIILIIRVVVGLGFPISNLF
jgi:O-antigen/teichoic acid export membrane protein